MFLKLQRWKGRLGWVGEEARESAALALGLSSGPPRAGACPVGAQEVGEKWRPRVLHSCFCQSTLLGVYFFFFTLLFLISAFPVLFGNTRLFLFTSFPQTSSLPFFSVPLSSKVNVCVSSYPDLTQVTRVYRLSAILDHPTFPGAQGGHTTRF